MMPAFLRRRLRALWTPTMLILLVAIVLALFDLALFYRWTPSTAEVVPEYVNYLTDLDTTLRRFRQFEPIYPLAAATHAALAGIPLIVAIDMSRFVLTVLSLFFAGKILYDLGRHLWIALPAMLVVNFSSGFWSLSVNLLRNFHGVMLTFTFVWVLLRLFQKPANPWPWRVASAVLFAAIVESHIVMAIIVSGGMALFFLLWLMRSFLPPKRAMLGITKHMLIVGAIAIFLTLPYDYIRFYLQGFWKTHEFILPQVGTAISAGAPVGVLGAFWALLAFGYEFFADFNPQSLHLTIYWVALLGAVLLLGSGIRRRAPAPLFLAAFFLFTFLASRNELLGLRILPDRFTLVLFVPAILALFGWLESLVASTVISRRAGILLAFVIAYLQLSYNIPAVVTKANVGEHDRGGIQYARMRGNPVIPDAFWSVITPKELREGKYTGVTIPGFEQDTVERGAETVEILETESAEHAWEISRSIGARFIYLDSLQANAYHYALLRRVQVREEKFRNLRYFTPVFHGYTELSEILLFRVNEEPIGDDHLWQKPSPTVTTAALTSTEAKATLQKAFADERVTDWVINFQIEGTQLVNIWETIATKDRTLYQLTEEPSISAQLIPGPLWNRLIVELPHTDLPRATVPNTLKGYISDGFVLGPLSPNAKNRIAWRVEQNEFRFYTRFDVAPDSSPIIIRYFTAKQLQALISELLVLLFALFFGVIWYADVRKARQGEPVPPGSR